MPKYIVNKTNMAYQFLNKTTIGRKGVIEVDEKLEKELSQDYFFKGLKERGVLAVQTERPKDLSEAGRKIAAKEAEISALNKKVKELEAKLDQAGAMGKKVSLEMDSSNPAPEQNPVAGENPAEEAPKEKKGKK